MVFHLRTGHGVPAWLYKGPWVLSVFMVLYFGILLLSSLQLLRLLSMLVTLWFSADSIINLFIYFLLCLCERFIGLTAFVFSYIPPKYRNI